VVAISRVGTCSASVVAVEAKAMHPTIVHVEPIVGDNGPCASRCHWHGEHWSWLVCNVWQWHGHLHCFEKCHMCTVESCLASGEFAQAAFLVFSGKMLTELSECLLGNGVYLPGVTSSGEDAGASNMRKVRSLIELSVRGLPPGDQDALDFAKVLPQGFNGIVWCPDSSNAGTIGLQLSSCDGAIVVAKMHDHCCHGDIGKSKCVVVKLSQV